MDWFWEFWASLTLWKILLGGGFFLLSIVVSFLSIGIVMVKIPANYFSPNYQHSFMPDTPWLIRWGAVIGKNILGVLLIIGGVIMLVGPGQGVLTILIGLVMLDIPGKRPIEARIIQRPAILAAVNSLRARYNKSPLVMD